MKIKTVLLTTSLAGATLMVAQPSVTGTGAQGYLERGRFMYESRNYVGAIDQLNHLSRLPATASMREEADYYLALSRFERDEAGGLQVLREFVKKYPSSLYLQEVLMKIGNHYFYHGEFGDALVAYTMVRDHALNADVNEDLLYRMAYCDLQLGSYTDARALYDRLKGTKRYDNATRFYEAYIDYAGKNYDAAFDKFTRVDRIGDLGYQSQYYMCQIEYTRKQYDKVISLGSSLLSDDANDYFAPEINRLVGESYYHKGKDKEARVHLNKYMATTQDEVVRSAAYALGVMDYKAGDHKAVVARMGQVTGVADRLAQSAYLYLGQSELKLGDNKLAAMAFEKAAGMNFDPAVKETAFFNYAVSQAKGNSTPFSSSIKLFEQFLNDYPKSKHATEVEGYLIDAYTTTGDYEQALASIMRINKPSARVLKAKQHVLYNLGVQAVQKGKKGEAAAYLQQAIKVGNYDKKILNESRLWLAETQYDNGDYRNTVKNLTSYLTAASRDDSNFGKAYYDLGYAQYKQKNYADARKSFQNAINTGNLDKDLVSDAYDRIGDTYYYEQNFADAEASYSKAIAEGSGSAENSMFDKAMMAGLSQNFQGKVDQLDELLRQYPHSAKAPAAMLEKGHALEAMGKNKQAIAAYEALYQRFPKVSEARQGLLQKALVEKNMGHAQEAIEAYKTIVATSPTSDEAKVAVEDLKVIYADRGELSQFGDFLQTVPNAPQLNVDDVEKLTFEAAEKAVTSGKPSIAKMEHYLAEYPAGAYAAQAKYYVGRYHYETGNLDAALTALDEALAQGEDASFAEDALAMKSDVLARQGRHAEAIDTYRLIVEKSTSDDNKVSAQLGILRALKSLQRWSELVSTADVLLQAPGLNADEMDQVKLNRAIANAKLGNTRTAESALKSLAKSMNTETGAQAAYELATLQFTAANYRAAEKSVNALLDSGSPQAYWIAKSYILLSDIYRKQGKKVEAREYLESLKSNYPGKEKEIFNEIDSRLKNMGVPTASQNSGTAKKQARTNKNNNASADNKAPSTRRGKAGKRK